MQTINNHVLNVAVVTERDFPTKMESSDSFRLSIGVRM